MSEYYRVVGVQENLETDGTEYVLASTNQPYIGKYHIHPTLGAMAGATHIEIKHDLLKPISQTSNSNQGSFGGY